jgi:hypothetical protein
MSDDLCQNVLSSSVIKMITKQIAIMYGWGVFGNVNVQFLARKAIYKTSPIKQYPVSSSDSEMTFKNEKG